MFNRSSKKVRKAVSTRKPAKVQKHKTVRKVKPSALKPMKLFDILVKHTGTGKIGWLRYKTAELVDGPKRTIMIATKRKDASKFVSKETAATACVDIPSAYVYKIMPSGVDPKSALDRFFKQA